MMSIKMHQGETLPGVIQIVKVNIASKINQIEIKFEHHA